MLQYLEDCSDHRTCYVLHTTDENDGEDNGIISTHWDTNTNDKLFTCYKNGLLKLKDLSITTSYRVFLQVYDKHSVEGIHSDRERGRKVNSHWDKLLTIPSRPNELIFVLGVSRSIYYTLLPASAETAVSNVDSRIRELYQHKSRVTSISVNHDGNLLASGDENGNIVVQILQLLKEPDLSPVSELLETFEKSLRNSTQHSSISRNVSLEDPTRFRVSSQHFKSNTSIDNTHPIFSLLWIPMATSSSQPDHSAVARSNTVVDIPDFLNQPQKPMLRSRSYILFSGSSDGFVRIWHVQLLSATSPQTIELKLTQLYTLPTSTTHVLCLNFIHAMPVQLQPKSLHEDLTNSSVNITTASASFHGSRTSTSSNINSSQDPNTSRIGIERCNPIYYISAGTSSGLIYMWRVSRSVLLHRLRVENSGFAHDVSFQNALSQIQQQIDSPAEDFTLCGLIQASNSPVVQVTSVLCTDSSTNITSTDDQANSVAPLLVLGASDAMGTLLIFCEKTMPRTHAQATSTETKLFITSADRELVPCAQAQFDSPVISCTFKPASGTVPLISASAVSSDSILAVYTYTGNCFEYSTSALRSLLEQKDETALSIQLRSQRQGTQSQHQKSKSSQLPSTMIINNTLTITKPPVNQPITSIQSIQSMHSPEPLQSSTTPTRMAVSALADTDIDVEPRSRPPPRAITCRLPPASPPSQLNMPIRVQNDRQQAEHKSTHQQQQLQLPSHQQQLLQPAQHPEQSAKRSPRAVVWAPNVTDKTNPSPPAAEVHSQTQVQSKDQIKDYAKKVLTNHRHSQSTPQSRHLPRKSHVPISQPHHKHAHSMAHQPDLVVTSALVHSALGHPSLNSSQALSQQVDLLRYKLAHQDEISVSTVHTTSTDRARAAKAVVAQIPYENRYRNLPPFSYSRPGQGFKGSKENTNLAKQVDSDWLLRKKLTGPTIDDYKLLSMEIDPIVETRIVDSFSGCKQHLPKLTRKEINSQIQTGQFVMTVDLPMKGIFGDPCTEALDAWTRQAPEREKERFKFISELI